MAIFSKPPDPSKFRAIFHIWPDFEISACINKSIATVKADAAQNSFSAQRRRHHLGGDGFRDRARSSAFHKHGNIDRLALHHDFTVDGGGPFDDENGHGTHVAGIIAGEWRVAPDAPKRIRGRSRFRAT